MRKYFWALFWILFFGFFLYKMVPKYEYLVQGLPPYYPYKTNGQKMILGLHVLSGIIVYAAGILQFTTYIRDRYIRFHRRVGKIYILFSLLCIATLYYMLPYGLCSICRISQYIVTNLWLVFIALAFYFIRRRNVSMHMMFMISSFICGAYFVMIRVVDTFLMSIFNAVSSNEDQALLLSDISVWFIPLLIFWTYWIVTGLKKPAIQTF